MTKAELIRKVAKRAGIPDQDAKFFFELFLKKASLQLHPGETIKLKGLGYFQLKTGRIKKTGTSGENEIYSDFMVFYSLNPDSSDSENLIFNIPVMEETRYNFIDSFFSLSFGKQVIPLKNAGSSEYFIPPTGIELRRLAEVKSEKLLQEVEVVDKYFKGSENLIFNPEEKDSTQIEMDWSSIIPDSTNERRGDIKSDSDNPLSWDFGNDLDKQIEEESILDTESDYNSDVTWNFGEGELKESPEEKKDTSDNEYKQVRSITSELNIPDFDILKQTINEEINNTKFPFSTDISEYNEEEKEIIDQNDFPEDEEFPVLEDYPVIEEDTVLEDTVLEDTVLENTSFVGNDTPAPVFEEQRIPLPEEMQYEETPDVRKKRGLGLFIILAIIVIISAAVLLYIKVIGPQFSGTKVIVEKTKTIPSNGIIDRSYDIPVTYPYDNTAKLNDFHDPYNIKSEVANVPPAETEQNVTTPDISSNQQNQIENGTSERVKDFIYKKGDKYLVQISSWQGKKYAERHAASLQERGMSTEIAKVDIDGETWYRVRVGYFNSIEEAETYFENNR